MSRVSGLQAGEIVGLEYVWDKTFSLDIIREQKLRFDEGWGRFEDRKFVMDYLRYCSNEKNSVWISPICVYEYYVNAGSISNSYDPGLLSKTRSCFLYIRKNLEYYDIFNGDVAEGYYHGYLNKIIGCVKDQKTRKQQKALEKQLLGDEDFLEGLRRYEVWNQHESREIPDQLKNKFL